MESAEQCAHDTFAEQDRAAGEPVPERTPASIERSRARHVHLLATDPDGAYVADRDGEVVGVALALRRESMWFLSLLVVDPSVQGGGIGRRLLDEALGTAEGARGAWLCSSTDPRALRRYASAGFGLHPALGARGPLDRSLLPAVTGVRPGSYDDDRDFIDDVARSLRGASYGADLAVMDLPLLVTDTPAGRGYAVVRPEGPGLVGATTPEAASRLLWTALAEATEPTVIVWPLTAQQSWAVDVVVAARLPLLVAAGGALAVRGEVGPLTPYLPSGAYG